MLNELDGHLSYDAIAFCEPAGWASELLTHFAVFDDQFISHAELRQLFNV